MAKTAQVALEALIRFLPADDRPAWGAGAHGRLPITSQIPSSDNPRLKWH